MELKLTITKEEINEMPQYIYDGKITLIHKKDQLESAIEELRKEKVLGFDTETRAAFKKGERYDVSLLQLATTTKVYLFRLNKTTFTPELASLLADPNIVKAGVAIRDDIIGLQKLCSFEDHGFVELADVAKSKNIDKFGLRALTAICLGKRLSKKENTSNWEKDQLTDSQLHYAACDAIVGYEIYHKLCN
jgi:ribonuclease D